MKQLLLVLVVFVLVATAGASVLGQPAFEYRRVPEPLGGPSGEYECEDDHPCVELNRSPGLTGCVLYDNTTNPTGVTFCWGGFAIGNEVVLAGADCAVTELLIGCYTAEPQYVDFRAQIYANDGPDGKPGTLLWDSGWVARWVPVGFPQQLISFPVPDVAVPDRITFTLEYLTQIIVIFERSEPPTIGEWIRCWWHVDEQWIIPMEEDTSIFMARVIAQSCGPSAVERTSWGRVKCLFR